MTHSHITPDQQTSLRQQLRREEQLKRLTLTHRGDMVWEILATDLGRGQSILDIAVGMFLKSGAPTLDVPLHALLHTSPAPGLRRILADLRHACIDVANALPILPLGGIEIASRWRHPELDASVKLRLKASLGASLDRAEFHIFLEKIA